jgi:hypothetical protein
MLCVSCNHTRKALFVFSLNILRCKQIPCFAKTLSREQRIQRNSSRVKTRLRNISRDACVVLVSKGCTRALSLLHFILLSDASNSSTPGNNRDAASSCASSEVTVDIVEAAATASPVTQCNSNMSRNWREASLMAGPKSLGRP